MLINFDVLQTESLPRGWVSTDHLCAVWCKQVVLSLVRALCDLTEPKSGNVSVIYSIPIWYFQVSFTQPPFDLFNNLVNRGAMLP